MEIGLWDALLRGFLQGVTEFLPVSSSGHLSLFRFFSGSAGEGSLFFSVMLHFGTLCSVIAAYYEDLWAMLRELGGAARDLLGGRLSFRTDNPNRKMLYALAVACVPMLAVLPLRGFVQSITEDGGIVAEGVCFLITSALLFAACRARRGRAGVLKMRPRHALAVGVAQGIAVLPGVSRSGATMSAGMVMGFDREFMVRFSFMLSIPAILGGAVAEIGDAAKEKVNMAWWVLFAGMLTAAVVGYLCIRVVRRLLLGGRFAVFAWYTLVLGVLVVLVGLVMHLAGFGSPAASASLPPASLAPSAASSSFVSALVSAAPFTAV